MNQSDSYAPFGTVTSGPPARPEKTDAERAAEYAADRVEYPAALKLLGLTPEEFEYASSLRRPGPISYTLTRSGQRTAVYSRTALNAWAAELKAFVQKVK